MEGKIRNFNLSWTEEKFEFYLLCKSIKLSAIFRVNIFVFLTNGNGNSIYVKGK